MHSAKLSEKGRYPCGFTGVAKRNLTSLYLETSSSIFNEVNFEMSESRGALPKKVTWRAKLRNLTNKP